MSFEVMQMSHVCCVFVLVGCAYGEGALKNVSSLTPDILMKFPKIVIQNVHVG